MGLLINNKDDVSLNHIRNLFALPLEQNCVSIRHSLLNVHQKCLSLLHQTLPLTRWTLLSKNLSLRLTSTTWLLHLHLHHPHINVLNYLTFPFTSGARFKISAFSSTALAFTAVYFSINGKLALGPRVKFLESSLDSNFIVWSLLPSITAPIKIRL